MTISKTDNMEDVLRLAMSDDLFAPESISLEPEGKSLAQYTVHTSTCSYWQLNACNCKKASKSLTVRLPEKFKRFNRKSLITIPAFNEDFEYEKEFLLL